MIVSPYELDFACPTGETIKTTIHHAYWPRAKYEEGIHTVFRNLVTNTFELYPWDHNHGRYGLHATYDPPRAPREDQMIDVVEEYLASNGVIRCIREHATRSVYEVTEERWEKVRGLYRSHAA